MSASGSNLPTRSAVSHTPLLRAGEVNQDLLNQAELTARAAIAIAAEAADAEEYVNCLDALADIFTDRKDYISLEVLEQEAIRRGAALAHPDPLRMAKRVHRLAVARHKAGHHGDALPALEKSLRLHEQSWGPESSDMAALLHEAGCIYRAQGEHKRAQECLSRALRLHEKLDGPESPSASADLQQLAGSYEDSGDLDKAAAQYERCLMLKLRQIGVKHIEEAAVMQYSLANLHVGWGNLPRARELMSDCIGSFRREGGPRLAVAHEVLAQIEERSGRYHSAIRELENGGKVWGKTWPQPRVRAQHDLSG
ncbi:MAG: tetratricopeptide repeat protein [Acidobacteriota bacterium]